MAKKSNTQKPFSLFDSSAMGAGFNMAYKSTKNPYKNVKTKKKKRG